VTESRLPTAKTTKHLPGIATSNAKSVFCLERRWRLRDVVPQNGDSPFGTGLCVLSGACRPVSFILALLETAYCTMSLWSISIALIPRQWSTTGIMPGALLISCNYCRV